MKFHLDSHSCIHPVSHPVYATGITNPQNNHTVVFMEWHVSLQLKLFILLKRNKTRNEGNIERKNKAKIRITFFQFMKQHFLKFLHYLGLNRTMNGQEI
jgi:hypothetical protein